MKQLLIISILFVSFNMFSVECVRTYKFTKCCTSQNMNNSVPNEEVRHGFEDAVCIIQDHLSYQNIEIYTNSAHPEFNFIIIANSYFPIVTPPPLAV